MKLYFSTCTANNQRQVLDRRGVRHRLLSFPTLRTKKAAECLRTMRSGAHRTGSAA